MRSHVWRPLWAFLALVGVLLFARSFLVPDDFGSHERGYMYGFHRLGNEQEWREQSPRYRSVTDCGDCHAQAAVLAVSPHAAIGCQNCHGPALDHPDSPPLLTLAAGGDLCLRCHYRLPYPSSRRGELPGISPDTHYPGELCTGCHDPHRPEVTP